jgi:PleD family two-component response regulator
VSIGATTKSGRPGVTPNELLAQADAALYEAKRAGRDRVAARALGP